MSVGALTLRPLPGMPEVAAGDDLAELVLGALDAAGERLAPGDALVVSSKVVSKALGLVRSEAREAAVEAETVRVVAERVTPDSRVTRVVEAAAGPVMAAAGVDASNTGPSGEVLLLPRDPDAEAARLRAALVARSGLPADASLAVVVADTAGRPWRAGLTDFALGAAGLAVLEDARERGDRDGRALAVTVRAVADALAAAADLTRGKADGVPVVLVRGLPGAWFDADVPGAAALLRTGASDWFALGHVEAVRAALGVTPGSAASLSVGLRPVGVDALAERVGRVVRLALHDAPGTGLDVEVAASSATVTLTTSDAYAAGRLVARLEVAAASEDLTAQAREGETGGVVVLTPRQP